MLLPYIWLGGYALPFADDFRFYVMSNDYGLLEGMLYEYSDWGGRYTQTLFNLISYGSLGQLNLSLVVWGHLLALWLGWTALFWSLSERGSSLVRLFLFGLGMLHVSLSAFAEYDLGDILYWGSSANTYLLGIEFLLLGLASFFRAGSSKGYRWVWMVLQGVFVLLAAGCNESIMFIQVVCYALIWVAAWYNRRLADDSLRCGSLWLEGYALGVAMLGALLVVGSPGNLHRMGIHERELGDWISLFPASLKSTFYAHVSIFGGAVNLLLLGYIALWLKIDNPRLPKISTRLGWKVWLLLPMLAALPARWGVGAIVGRVSSVLVAVSLIGLFLLVLSANQGLLAALRKRMETWLPASILVLAVLMLSSQDFRRLRYQIEQAPLLKKEWKGQEEYIIQNIRQGTTDITVPPLKHQHSRLRNNHSYLLVEPLSTDHSHWINTTYLEYLHWKISKKDNPQEKPSTDNPKKPIIILRQFP